MKIVKTVDLQRKLTPVSIHGRQAEKLARGFISPKRLKSSFHVIEVSGSGRQVIYSAGDGLVRLTRYAPGGKITFAVVSRVKLFRQALRWSYYQMTRIRNGSKTCSIN
jgi:hypothetical protein